MRRFDSEITLDQALLLLLFFASLAREGKK